MLSREERLAIVEIAREIAGSPHSPQKAKWFKAKYPSFAKDYEPLFNKCCEPDIDRRMFDFLLEQFANLGETKQSGEDANRQVMHKLSELYVVPVLKDLPIPPQ